MLDIRAACLEDVPAIEALLRAESLPAERVVEELAGFLVATNDGLAVACGGVELYPPAAVVRSVVTHRAHRNSGIGSDIVRELESMAAAAGTSHLCLFTVGAWQFWQKLGYEDGSLAAWPEPARACWQYRYVSTHLDEFQKMGLRSMFKHIEGTSGQSSWENRRCGYCGGLVAPVIEFCTHCGNDLPPNR